MPERELRHLPPLFSLLEAQEAADGRGRGFDLRYRTLDGLDRVAVQIALDFPPGGIWETADTRTKPVAGQTLFLKQGYGVDALRQRRDRDRPWRGGPRHVADARGRACAEPCARAADVFDAGGLRVYDSCLSRVGCVRDANVTRSRTKARCTKTQTAI